MKTAIKPNLFILGGPKCGTTALSEYLRSHPDIYISDPKEPNYFNTDFSDEYRWCHTENEYLRCFSGSEKETVVGEGSPIYLFSKTAVENIKKFQPNAKYIVMLRNPIDMAHSLYSGLFYSLREDAPDFQTAWQLQEERLARKKIPSGCPDEKILQYGQVCRLGEQVERLYQTISSDNVLIIFYEDFKNETAATYRRSLEFLEVEDDGRRNFLPVNQHKTFASQRIRHFAQAAARIKQRLRISQNFGVFSFLEQKNNSNQKRPDLPVDFRIKLFKYFESDIVKLAALTNRDLSHWK